MMAFLSLKSTAKFFIALTSLLLTGVLVAWFFLVGTVSQEKKTDALSGLVRQIVAWQAQAELSIEDITTRTDGNRLQIILHKPVLYYDNPQSTLAFNKLILNVIYGWHNGRLLQVESVTLDTPHLVLMMPDKPALTTDTAAENAITPEPAVNPVAVVLDAIANMAELPVEGIKLHDGLIDIINHNNETLLQITGLSAQHFAKSTKEYTIKATGDYLHETSIVPLVFSLQRHCDDSAVPYCRIRLTGETNGALVDSFNDDNPIRLISLAQATVEIDPELRTASLEKFVAESGASRLSATGRLDWRNDSLTFKTKAEANVIPLSLLHSLWPTTVASNTRTWITDNISEGKIHLLSGTLAGTWQTGDTARITSLNAQGTLEGFAVRYAPDMPPITGIKGSILFDDDAIDVIIREGQLAENMPITIGKLRFTDLNQAQPHLQITSTVDGNLGDVIEYLEASPLALATALSIDAAAIRSASGETNLTIDIPLIHDLDADSIPFTSDGQYQVTQLPIPHTSAILKDGNIAVTSNRDSATIKGNGLIENLASTFQATIASTDAGFNLTSLQADMTGDADNLNRLLQLKATKMSGKASGSLSFSAETRQAQAIVNLVDTAISCPLTGWEKASGVPAHITLVTTIDTAYQLQQLQIKAHERDANLFDGTLMFNTDTAIQTLRIDTMTLGKNRFTGAAIRQPDNSFAVTITGDSLDLRGLLQHLESNNDTAARSEWASMSIAGTINALHIAQNHNDTLEKNQLNAEITAGKLAVATLSGIAGRGSYSLTISKQDDDYNAFMANADDGGAFLQRIGMTEQLQGGKLQLHGKASYARPTTFAGTLSMRDFRLIKAPTLARVLSAASIAGSVELLRGDGISFDSMKADLQLRDNVVTIADGQMVGSSLGFQLEGTIDRTKERVDLRGAILPAFVVTRIIGGIPVLGDILTSDQQEGVIAMRYSARGAWEDPQVTVNPLSALTPGFLRKFFDIFESKPQ